MDKIMERRSEQRLSYHWPVWFAEDFDDSLLQGQMVDVSSGGAAFTCHAEGDYYYEGQELTTRFSIPCFGCDDSFEMANFVRSGRVCRVDNVNNFVRRIAVQFAEPLPFKPGEQVKDQSDAAERLRAVTI